VTFVDAINVENNVINNKWVFSAEDHALIKLLRQENGYGAERLIAKFPSKPWTLLRKIDTSRFGVTSQKPL